MPIVLGIDKLTLSESLSFERNSSVTALLGGIIGCRQLTHVVGTNGGTMPCGTPLTQFGRTSRYYCARCEDRLQDLATFTANRIIYHAEFVLSFFE